jgi:hypothetical protein
MAPGMLARTSMAGMLGALFVVGAACLTPEPTVLREALSVSSATPVPSPVAAASPVRGPRVRVVGEGGGEVNFRAEPNAGGARLKVLSDGTELELLGWDVEVGGRT